MRIAPLLILTAALSLSARAQTPPPPPTPPPAPVWKQVTTEDSATRVDVPAGTVIRWCDQATGQICSPNETFATATTFFAYCPLVTMCNADDATDGLSGKTKVVMVLETAAIQTILIDDSPTVVPALPPPPPPPSWPPVSFAPGTSYWTLVANLPPTANGALQGLVKLYDGDKLIVTLVCTMGSALVVTTPSTVSPPSLAAPFGCVAQPVSTQ